MHQHQYFQSATINAKRKEQAQNVDTFFTTRNFYRLLIKFFTLFICNGRIPKITQKVDF